jgi:predicted RNA binding protein YcfA (HicA-like mRNA interferase family)
VLTYHCQEEHWHEKLFIKDVLKILKADGWYEVNVVGSHHQFKHPVKKGRVTLKPPDKDIPRKTLDSIERQSGLLFR